MSQGCLRIALVGIGLIVAATGCVAQSEYDAQVMSNRKLREELEHSRIELQDARNQAELARSRLSTIENELFTKDELVANLSGERDRHLDAFRKAQGALELLASRTPQDPVVLTQALPPALDRALRDFATRYPERVDFDSKRGIVKWKSDLLFALGSDVVMESAKGVLQEFAQIMDSESAEPFDVTVVGHTDTTPIARPETRRIHPTNWHLSTHRSIAVMHVLRGFGIDENRMAVMGYGELRPLVPNTDDASKAKNRRVEVFVVPRDSVALMDAEIEAVNRATRTELFRPTDPSAIK